MAEIAWLAYHHTGGGPARPTVLETACYQTSKTAHLPFPAIAYHRYVEADGAVSQCHDLEVVTWHVGANSPTTRDGVGIFNWQAIGVAFAGENPTPAQIVALRVVGDEIDARLGRRLLRLGHSDICGPGSTECPGATWPEWRHDIEIA